jgi:hypothetical protein
MTKTLINREREGFIIAQIEGSVKRINELKYIVKSQSRKLQMLGEQMNYMSRLVVVQNICMPLWMTRLDSG